MYDIRQRLLFTLAGLAKRTGRRRVRAAAVRRTQSNRTRQSAARLAIAAEFSVAADAADNVLSTQQHVHLSQRERRIYRILRLRT